MKMVLKSFVDTVNFKLMFCYRDLIKFKWIQICGETPTIAIWGHQKKHRINDIQAKYDIYKYKY